MAATPNPLTRFLAGLLLIYRVFRSVILNLLFLFLVLIIVASLGGQPPLQVPAGAALVLNPDGFIVEQQSFTNLDRIINEASGAAGTGEVLLQDLLDVIDHAAQDARISALVLDTDNLTGGGLSHLQDIGTALQAFRATGKRIYAVGDNYTQAQYYLASQADEIMLNSYGAVGLEGLSAWQNYFGEALVKLGVNIHVFRVGEYKAAVEPFERNDMSPEARANYSQLLADLWQAYLTAVSTSRALPDGLIEDLINNQDQYLAMHAGDSAQMALQNNLVDRVETRADSHAYLTSVIGERNGTFPAVNWQPYLRLQQRQRLSVPGAGTIGLIVASGTIVDGSVRRGAIGGDSLATLIRQATEDDAIEALVLRIDSGGGSAFASEVIRAELAAFRATGRPVVASMGSVAASGGYWIATPADQIWASPATITGSIGIFGIYPTFETTFEKLGIGTDGVGTTELAGFATVGRELSPLAERSLQLTVEHGYSRFLNLVAASRNMSVAAVDAVAQGQIWSGETALGLGLVDRLGSLEDAVQATAELAGLGDAYTVRLIEAPLSPAEQLLQQLTGNVLVGKLLPPLVERVRSTSVLERMLSGFSEELDSLLSLNDPNALYLRCLECARGRVF
jgi:protease-4